MKRESTKSSKQSKQNVHPSQVWGQHGLCSITLTNHPLLSEVSKSASGHHAEDYPQVYFKACLMKITKTHSHWDTDVQ